MNNTTYDVIKSGEELVYEFASVEQAIAHLSDDDSVEHGECVTLVPYAYIEELDEHIRGEEFDVSLCGRDYSTQSLSKAQLGLK